MACRRTDAQKGSCPGELSGIGGVGRSVEEFGPSGRELADTPEASSRQQGKCDGNPSLHGDESLERNSPSPRFKQAQIISPARRESRSCQLISSVHPVTPDSSSEPSIKAHSNIPKHSLEVANEDNVGSHVALCQEQVFAILRPSKIEDSSQCEIGYRATIAGLPRFRAH